MAPSPLERLLGGIDRPLMPQSEFAEALFDRLLIELEQGTDLVGGPATRSQEEPMINATAHVPASPRQGVRLPASPTKRGRRDRALAYLATAALAALTLVGSFLALGPHWPGEQEQDPRFLAAPSGMSATPGAGSEPVAEFLWKADGEPNSPFAWPTGAAIDPQGNIWVTDGGNDRIVVLAPGGRVLSPEGVVLDAWGRPGSGEGEFDFTCAGLHLAGVAFDAAGNIYVADSGNHRIQKFGADRTFLTSWGSKGSPDDRSFCPLSIVVDGQGRVYVSDHTGGKIEVFDSEGQPLATWTEGLSRPEQVAIDGDGNIWVADSSTGIRKFSPHGDLLIEWDTGGAGKGALYAPMGIAVDAQGRVFVSGQSIRVQVFSPEGEFLGDWGSPGGNPGQFTEPANLVLDGMGHIYVVDLFGSHVQKFRLFPPFAL